MVAISAFSALRVKFTGQPITKDLSHVAAIASAEVDGVTFLIILNSPYNRKSTVPFAYSDFRVVKAGSGGANLFGVKTTATLRVAIRNIRGLNDPLVAA